MYTEYNKKRLKKRLGFERFKIVRFKNFFLLLSFLPDYNLPDYNSDEKREKFMNYLNDLLFSFVKP